MRLRQKKAALQRSGDKVSGLVLRDTWCKDFLIKTVVVISLIQVSRFGTESRSDSLTHEVTANHVVQHHLVRSSLQDLLPLHRQSDDGSKRRHGVTAASWT